MPGMKNDAEYRFNVTRYRGDLRVYTSGAVKHLTHLKNDMIVNLERFMIRAMFALDPPASLAARCGPSSTASRTIARTYRRSNLST
jgi:hypothetical protein